MKKTTLLMFILAIAVLLVSCAGPSPDLTLDADTFEFGDVVNGMIAEKDITITNRGSAPLVIEAVSTSCGCTTAEVNPMAIGPGESAVLHIEFDSGAHGPELTGELMRQVFLQTNDPDQPEALVTFTANVVQ